MIRMSTGLRTKMLGDGSDKSFKGLMAGGVIRIYSGSQPSNADITEPGVLLAEITLLSGAFTPGSSGGSTNGLTFENAANAEISKTSGQTWSGDGIAIGNMGWFRFYDSNRTTGSSSTAVRFDGSISSSGGQISTTNTAVDIDTPLAINTFVVDLPLG